MRVFENRVLRSTFGPKRDEVTREWRRLHNEELYALYSSPNIMRVIKSIKNVMRRACSSYGGEKVVYRVLVGKSDAGRPLGRSRCRQEDNIEMNLRKVDWGAWIESICLRIRTGDGLL